MHALVVDEQRNVLACVICAAEGGVAAVICRQNQQILLAEQREHLRQAPVDGDQRIREAAYIAPVPVEHVRINEIREAKPVKRLTHIIQPSLHAGRIAGCVIRGCQTAVREDVLDFADTEHRHAGVLHRIEQRSPKGFEGEVAPPIRPRECAGVFADKGTRDDTSDRKRSGQHFARGFAHCI